MSENNGDFVGQTTSEGVDFIADHNASVQQFVNAKSQHPELCYQLDYFKSTNYFALLR